MKFEIDTSTINQKKLNLLPAFKKPETYSVQESPGQYETKHPVNGTWCQMCGWRDK